MDKLLNPQKYLEQVENINAEACSATLELLKSLGEKRYIVAAGDDIPVDATSIDNVFLTVYGVGLDDEGKIVVLADVDYVGCLFGEEDFPSEWTDVAKLKDSCYPGLYRFVADYMDKAVTKEETNKMIEEYKECGFE